MPPAKSYILTQSGPYKKWGNAGKRFSIDAPRLITILVVGIANTCVDVLIYALHPSDTALLIPAPVIRVRGQIRTVENALLLKAGGFRYDGVLFFPVQPAHLKLANHKPISALLRQICTFGR